MYQCAATDRSTGRPIVSVRRERGGRQTVTARRRHPAPLKYCGNRSRDALSSHVTFAADESSTPELSKCTEIFYQKYVSVLVMIATLFVSLINKFSTRFILAKTIQLIIQSGIFSLISSKHVSNTPIYFRWNTISFK